MRFLFLLVLFSSSFLVSRAAFVKDSTFISYKEFSLLSKKEIKARFYKDDDSQKIIDNYYRHRNKGLGSLFLIVPLTALGIYFADLGANSSTGMGGVIGLVLAIILLLPALLLTIRFFTTVIFRKKAYTKKFFYNELKEYFESHYQK